MAPDRSKVHQSVRLDLLSKHYNSEKNNRRSLFAAGAVDGDAQHVLRSENVGHVEFRVGEEGRRWSGEAMCRRFERCRVGWAPMVGVAYLVEQRL